MNKHVESDLMLKALIFDVDGTLADTESAHLAAFNHAFSEQGLDWHWDVALYTSLLEISGGKERMLHYWNHVHPDMKDIDGSGLRDTIDHLHALKTAAYEAAVQGGAVQLRPGVLALIQQAHQQGLRLAIATTTSPVNIAVLLRNAIGPDWKDLFIVIEDASTAPKKKPHPQVYVQTLARLGLPPLLVWLWKTLPMACVRLSQQDSKPSSHPIISHHITTSRERCGYCPI